MVNISRCDLFYGTEATPLIENFQRVGENILKSMYKYDAVISKGVGPGPTLAWAGWRQPDIPVEVDTDRLETSRFKKCYANCVLLYFPIVLNSRVLLMYTDTVEELPGYPVQNYLSGSFLF